MSAGLPPLGDLAEGSGSREATQGIATAIAEVSERASLLVREEIELAKAEVGEKATKLVKGAIVGVVAGVFFLAALVFALVGCAWLLYFYLPIGNDYTFFYGFFAMAVILVVLGILAGLVAAKAVKKGSPPVPTMAIEEARKIRESVGPGAAAMAAAPEQAPPQYAPAQVAVEETPADDAPAAHEDAPAEDTTATIESGEED